MKLEKLSPQSANSPLASAERWRFPMQTLSAITGRRIQRNRRKAVLPTPPGGAQLPISHAQGRIGQPLNQPR